MNVRVQLLEFDELTLTLRVGAWNIEAPVKRVELVDRHGLVVATEEVQPERPVDLRAERLPRGRFPLFLAEIDVKGTRRQLNVPGPIFPLPEELEQNGHIPLPRAAVNLNTPKIRSWVTALRRGEDAQRQYEATSRHLLLDLKGLRRIVSQQLLLLAALAAASVSGASGERPWLAVPPGLGGLAIVAVLAALRAGIKRRHAALEDARLARDERLSARDQALAELKAHRLLGRVLGEVHPLPDNCACGGEDAR